MDAWKDNGTRRVAGPRVCRGGESPSCWCRVSTRKKNKQKNTDGNCERQVSDSSKGLGAVGAWGVLIIKGGGAGGASVTCWVPGWLDGDAGGGHVEIDVARVCAVGR